MCTMQMVDLSIVGLPRGDMQGHGKAARPTWDDSKEWVGKRVDATVRAWQGQD